MVRVLITLTARGKCFTFLFGFGVWGHGHVLTANEELSVGRLAFGLRPRVTQCSTMIHSSDRPFLPGELDRLEECHLATERALMRLKNVETPKTGSGHCHTGSTFGWLLRVPGDVLLD